MPCPMSRIVIQIYEIQDASEVPRLAEIGMDHLGTVITSQDPTDWPPLLKTVQTIQACGLKSTLIPLFSEPSLIFRALSYFKPDLLHLCEALPAANTDLLFGLAHFQGELKANFPEIGIIRSIGIPRPGLTKKNLSDELRNIIDLLAPCTDYFLLDTIKEGEQPVRGFLGITGEICDWSLAREIVEISPRPVILAGGLGPDNVASAIKFVRPAGVDSCSRTNALDEKGAPIRFRKDLKLVSLFVREVRRMEKLLSGS